MRRRIYRLLLNTISYIEEMLDNPFSSNVIKCAFRDLVKYAEYVEDNKAVYIDQVLKVFWIYIEEGNSNYFSLEFGQLKKVTFDLQSNIHVDFIILRQTHWGAIRPLVDAFLSRKCKVRIIPTPMIQEQQDHWGKELAKLITRDGYSIVDFEKYDIEKEIPDIVIDNMAVDCAKIPEVRFLRVSAAVENIIHIEHSILTGYNEVMKRAHFRIGRSRCWQYVVPSPLFSVAFPLIFRIDGDFLPLGCPELDSVFSISIQKEKDPQKAFSVLWNIDALDPDKDVPGDFERLEKEIYYLGEMASKYPDIQNVVRVHPNFCNQERCAVLQKQLDILSNNNGNIVYDTNALIYETYNDVDAMVTWMSSSTLFSFGATGKPVIVIPTFINGGYDTMLDMRMLQVIPIAFSKRDIELFFDTMKNDFMKEKRMKILKEYTGPVDGTASIKIVNEALRRYEEYFKRVL